MINFSFFFFSADSNGEPLCIISSSAESGADLFEVKYFKVAFFLMYKCEHIASISALVLALALIMKLLIQTLLKKLLYCQVVPF